MQNLVASYNCGWSIEPNDESLKTLIVNLTSLQTDEKKNNLKTISKYLCWENEEKELHKHTC